MILQSIICAGLLLFMLFCAESSFAEKVRSEEEKNDAKPEPTPELESKVILTTIDVLRKNFRTIKSKCPQVRHHMERVLEDLDLMEALGDSVTEFAAVCHNKTLVPEIKQSYEKVKLSVLQNARDINTICITSQVLRNKKFRNNEEEAVYRELNSNQRILEKFQELLSIAGQKSIQHDDAFSSLDLDSSYTAVSSFLEFGNTISDPPQNNKRAL